MCLAIASSGCATIGNGTSQAINVGSTPEGAECVFTREGQTLGTITTPGQITVKRGRAPINVVCTKNDHEDARAVLNSLTTTDITIVPPFAIVAAVAGVATLVDMASGADTHYQTALMVKLEPFSAADQAVAVRASARANTAPAAQAAAATPTPGPGQAPVGATATAASVSTAAPGPFDGDYNGTILRSSSYRQVDVHVVGGSGVGTVRLAKCAGAGAIKLVIDPSGAIQGDADILVVASCESSSHKLTGRADGNRLLITLEPNKRFQGADEFPLIKRGNSN